MSKAIDKLDSRQCSNLSADIRVLDHEDVIALSKELDPPWPPDSEERNISHRYTFENYYQTIAFVNVIAQIAHQQDHHPDLTVSYNHCTVTYTTQSVGGLSIKDFICAAKINLAQIL